MKSIVREDGVELRFEVHDYTDPWKNSPLLVLQHGFGRSSRHWYRMIPYLSRFYKVVCPNLRGLREVPLATDQESVITLDDYIADLASIVDGLEEDSIHFAGESLGGMLGFIFAAQCPQRVRTLSVFSAPLNLSPKGQKTLAVGHATWQEAIGALGPLEWARRRASAAEHYPPETDPLLLEWLAQEIGDCGLNGLLAMSRLLLSMDVTPFLEKIRCPVLGIYPTNDSLIPDDHEKQLRAGIKNLRIVHLSSKYHMLHIIAPATCAAHVLHFMAAYDGIACHEA